MTTGILLINLGTPQQPQQREVAAYLRQFLMDPKVVDLPFLARWILVNCIIAPFRAKTSAAAYQKIWTAKGSPLLIHSQRLREEVGTALGVRYKVVLGMRYGEPSIENALRKLKDCSRILILPLFPQFAEASTGSALAEVNRAVKKLKIRSMLLTQRDFYTHLGFVAAQAELVKRALQHKQVDHILFSYHGLPVRQINKASACRTMCDRVAACPVINEQNKNCYRAQCFATTNALVAALKLPKAYYSTSFQSRLGRTPWIGPYTDTELNLLAQKGVKKLAVVCPAFVADCLETLEEINIRAREQWLALGGEELVMVPCVNASSAWISAVMEMIKTIEFAHEKESRRQPA